MEVETRRVEKYDVDASVVCKRNNFSIQNIYNGYSLKVDNVIVRSVQGKGFQFKRQDGKIGKYNLASESPILHPCTVASIIEGNALLEYPYSIFTIDDACKVVQRKHGQSELVYEQEEAQLPIVMYEDLANDSFYFPHTYSHPDLLSAIQVVLKHGFKYWVCHKYDGTQERVQFCGKYMMLLNSSQCIPIDEPINSPHVFLAEYMKDIDKIILYDVCVNAVVAKRISVLKSLPTCSQFEIQTFEERSDMYIFMQQETRYPTDGYIVSFPWMKHQFKYKFKPTIDVEVQKDYIFSGDGVALCSTPQYLKSYIGNVVEVACDGTFVGVRMNKSKGNDLFSIYCTFASS